MRISARSKSLLSQSWARAFAVTLFFVTLASGLFWLDFFRDYRGEMSILVIGKGEMAGNSDEIASGLSEIAGTLMFYDKLTQQSGDVSDPFSGLAPDKRKASWQKALSAEKKADGSTILLTSRAKDPDTARTLVRDGGQTLFALASFYYTIQTDADLRVVDGPITRASLSHPFLFVIASFATAFAVTSLFFGILHSLPYLFGKKPSDRSGLVPAEHPQSFVSGDSVPWIDPQKFVAVKPEGLSFEGSESSDPAPVRGAKKASAPDNLPVAEDGEMGSLPFATADLPFTFEDPSSDEAEELLPPIPPYEPQGEPTAEEYKRRLNELLSGGK